MRRRLVRLAAVAGLAGTVLAVTTGTAVAHPLGNFSVNTYSAVVVEPDAVRVDVVVDRAEIPTQQTYPELDQRAGALPEQAGATAERECAAVADGARLSVAGRPIALQVAGAALSFPPGAAGLRTARLTCRLSTAGGLSGLVGSPVQYSLSPPTAAAGWHETTAVGDGTVLRGADVPAESISDGLRAYPDDLLSSPLDVRGASFEVAAGSGVVGGAGDLLDQGPLAVLPRGADRITDAFTGLVAREQLSAGFMAGALALAVLLGSAHAFAPGHGKTVMAAYLVGQRGSLRDVAVIGASVTLTHTLGVVTLGVVLSAVGLASPAGVYPWLTLVSGLLLVGIGVALLRAARRRGPVRRVGTVEVRELVTAGAVSDEGGAPGVAAAHEHHHQHDSHDGHDHDHDPGQQHDHGHDAEPHSHGLLSHTHAVPARGSGLRGLLTVGFAGGLVPSPSALVVLLGGIALGRAWFGLLLVLAYGVGMAVALALAGLLLTRARDRVSRFLQRREATGASQVGLRMALLLPALTAGVVVVIGAGIAARAGSQLL